jgi:guanylate kinase
MREGEKDGVDYHFIDRTSFEDMVKNDGFAEWAEVHGHLYGTTRAQLEAAIREGRDLLLDIDVQGGMSIKRAFPEAVAIFLLPPSMEVLKQRLSGRATDSPEQIRLRLENARHELTFKDRYDHTVVNDAFQRAAEEIARIMGLN